MVDGIMARVGDHSEVEVRILAFCGAHPPIELSVNLTMTSASETDLCESSLESPNAQLLAANSSVPVINALSARYHPTQIMADLLTMLEAYTPSQTSLSGLAELKVAWVGDSNNILNDMLVSYPRLGINLSVATPKGKTYERDELVWGTMQDGLRAPTQRAKGEVTWTNDPKEAVRDADIIVTDTW